MAYPSLEQYNEALQSPQLVLLDPELKRGSLRTTGLGLPLALCGGFALTYAVTVGAKKFALRCFHKESRELEHRYQAISSRLKQLNSPYFLNFEFNPAGIRIQGSTYPTVKMAWASGTTLAEFLEAKYADKSALTRLRAALISLAAYLEQNNVAHGDIQPENLMVSADGSAVQLIDYDGLYVESLKGAKATELGQLNFQHPQRSADDFGPTLDRFSLLTLDVALQVLIAAPSMWASTKSEPSAVVFRRNDFLDPTHSTSFQSAVAIPSARAHVENLAKVAAAPFLTIPSLAEFLKGKGVPAGPISISSAPKNLTYQGPYVVADAANYGQVLQLVGNRVELVGCVQEVRRGRGRNGKPYIFVNFADWRGLAVKLSIWSDGMNVIRTGLPDAFWVGRWVSVTGLVDPPYSNSVRVKNSSRSISYTHLSITITSPGQIQTLAEKDARFRLQVAGKPVRAALGGVTTQANSRNANIIKGMGGAVPSPGPLPQPSPNPSPSQSRNQAIVGGMQRQSTTPPPMPPRRPPVPGGAPPKPVSSNVGCWPVVIAGTLFAVVLKMCAG
ncbi:protein kinase family protein [Stenotrophomonas maltophilia]|uniref:protein kinase family protein n=1 Tax=Stenotrophomonas maltophilia TaxID=40324 RepID=UPI0021CA70FC|nr:protein kinase family protein [Stenotrophomonas maltophilia]MCU1066653.1 protein kinase family protein [Stenotrophomonas maltophilia]MCU1076330.1 protein kinase family protein [Stenotrophomonas maltophilia]MCU1137609.1 protein kinase family protein [Stenotrophomonas maltophilia]